MIDFQATPCHSKETVFGGTEDSLREDCVRDQEAVYAYLENSSMISWFNYSSLKHNGFEKDERIADYSGVHKYPINTRESSLKDVSIHVSHLVDETDLFQLG